MGIIPDWMIKEGNPVTPLLEKQEQAGVISYGLGSYGYDARVGYKFKVFTPVHCGVVDPKNFDVKSFVEVDVSPGHKFDRHTLRCTKCGMHHSDWETTDDDTCNGPTHIDIPPNSFALAESMEVFNIPRDVLAVCVGKSTYARCGIIINVTPLEPEWRGKVTIEISNTTPLPARIYAGEGIMQVLFFRADQVCRVSYADKKGKYQDQAGLTLPFVNKKEE